MNLNHLAIFRAVAEERSVTRGADRLGISQPAVSKQLRQFEKTLGTRLVDRLPEGLRLTAAGETLLPFARSLFAVEREAARAMEELRGLSRGQLTIGASMTIGVYLLPRLLQSFRERYPEIRLEVRLGNTSVVQGELVRHELDLALTEGFVEAEELVATEFATDELVVIVPAKHPLRGKKSVTARQVLEYPLILREPGSGTRAVIERAFEKRKLRLEAALSLGNVEAIKQSVLAGLGIAIVSRLAIESELRDGTLGVVGLSDLKMQRPLHLLQHADRSPSAAAATFRQVILRGVRQVVS